MIRLLGLIAVLHSQCLTAGPPTAASLARGLREALLDPEACFHVRDIRLAREDLKVYLTDGYLVFAKPVEGAPRAAVFSAETEHGEAEALLMPPTSSERRSLAKFTGTPNLNERFRGAILVFSDETAAELRAAIDAGPVRPAPEMGRLLAERFNDTLRNFYASFEVRLVQDLLHPSRAGLGFFYCAASGSRLGNFDLVYDPRLDEQITSGALAYRDDRSYFDVWTSFAARSFRNGARRPVESEFAISGVTINATLEADLQLKTVTRLTLLPREPVRALAFELSPHMRISSATLDGAPVEVYQPDSLRANLLRGPDNNLVLLVADAPLTPGRSHELEVAHDGKVILQAGNGVYYVGARGNWYPNRRTQFARYETTFRYPKNLSLVATGEVAEDRTEGEWRITRRTTPPVRLVGFNLGNYDRESVKRGGLTVEVYANRRVEPALQPPSRALIEMPQNPSPFPRGGRRGPPDIILVPAPPPNPTARLAQLAGEIAAAFDFMAERFGPPPLKTLTVSPIPGRFGQGFPGLVYLSTLTYIDPQERPSSVRSTAQQTFFSEILHAHETAHQWWGNSVTSAGYQDDWLMEALANYSALLFLEKQKGQRALENVLAHYRDNLLAKGPDGNTVESHGPVTWGSRLISSQSPNAWAVITYEKGSWILHMLRRRMGDDAFYGLLGELHRGYKYKAASTADFQKLAAQFMPAKAPGRTLDGFFEHWVHSTGIPGGKLSYSARGKAPKIEVRGEVELTGAADDAVLWVPLEIQTVRGKPATHWVRAGASPEPFRIVVSSPVARVLMDPSQSVLMNRK